MTVSGAWDKFQQQCDRYSETLRKQPELYALGISDIPVREGDITSELRRIMKENSEQVDKLLADKTS
jgi:hypothetical protein